MSAIAARGSSEYRIEEENLFFIELNDENPASFFLILLFLFPRNDSGAYCHANTRFPSWTLVSELNWITRAQGK